MYIRKATKNDYNDIMKIWESAVKATHDFLTKDDFLYYKKIIPVNFLPVVDLYVLMDDKISGFIGVSGEQLEMLFIDADSRSKGYGKTLLHFAIKNLHIKYLDVNEQNMQAIGFYEKMGFYKAGRSEKDSMGKDYPIVHYQYIE